MGCALVPPNPARAPALVRHNCGVTQSDVVLDRFRGGVAELRRGAELAGHVASEIGSFRSICWPFSSQPQVWLVVVWADGTKQRAVEDYPPWSHVRELDAGRLEWIEGPDRTRHGTYEARWLSESEAKLVRESLGITLADF